MVHYPFTSLEISVYDSANFSFFINNFSYNDGLKPLVSKITKLCRCLYGNKPVDDSTCIFPLIKL